MDNFKAVYKILSTLEKSMDLPEADLESIDHKALDMLNDPPKMVHRSTTEII